jgi:hypothetical protein
MMRHHDLASLALEADAIVVAERTGGPDEAAVYRVVHVLAGQGLRTNDAIAIYQSGYVIDTTGERRWGAGVRVDAPVSPIAILFLRAAIHPSDSAWSLVPSGLRVFAGGRAYRFEQRSNPGPYVAVPQGRDPEDLQGVATSVQWDRPQLERAIASAVERADRARAAIAARDPAQILTLLPADPVTDLVDVGWHGFYEDRIAIRGFDALIAAGEIDAALDVHARTRGLRHFVAGISDSELLARAESSSAPLPRRIAALSLLDPLLTDDTLRRLIAIAHDADAPPALRVAAIRALAGAAGVSTSNLGWPARRRRLATHVRSLVRELAPRALGSVRVELVACAARWKLLDAVPTEHAIAASATQRDHVVTYHVVAAPGVETTLRRVTLLRRDGTACDAESLGGWSAGDDWSGRIDAVRCSEAVQVRIEVRRGGRDRAWNIPIEY